MKFIGTLFDLIFPLFMAFVVWRIVVRAKKQQAGSRQPQNSSAIRDEPGLNPLDVIKAMLTGNVEAIKEFEQRAKGRTASDIQEDRPAPAEALQLPPKTAWAPTVRASFPRQLEKERKEVVGQVSAERNAIYRSGGDGRSKGELRKAVVWAEILSPPVALRSE